MTRAPPSVVVALACACACACGGRPPPPAPPPAPDAARLARVLHDDLAILGELARRHREDCRALVAALAPHVARMRAHVDEVKRATRDPEVASRFEVEARRYATGKAQLTDAIAHDLASANRTCRGEELVDVIKQIPHW